MREHLLELWEAEAASVSARKRNKAEAARINAMGTVEVGVQGRRIEDLDIILDKLKKYELLTDMDGSSLAAILQTLYGHFTSSRHFQDEIQDIIEQRPDRFPEASIYRPDFHARLPKSYGTQHGDGNEWLKDRLDYLEEKFVELRQDIQFVRQYEQGEREISWAIRGIIITVIIALISIAATLNWSHIVEFVGGIP